MDTKDLRAKAEAAIPGPWVNDGDNVYHERLDQPNRHLANAYVSYRSDDEIAANAEWITAANPSVILSLLDELERTRSSNEAMRKALELSHRLFLPIFMQLAEADLVGEPVKDEEVLFSFMGSGASDHVTVGDFRRSLDAVRAALSPSTEVFPKVPADA